MVGSPWRKLADAARLILILALGRTTHSHLACASAASWGAVSRSEVIDVRRAECETSGGVPNRTSLMRWPVDVGSYVSKVKWFRCPFDMDGRGLARDQLWDVAASQHGHVTAQQATDLGISKEAIQMLVQRGTLERVSFGVYRFPRFPVSEADPYMLAVLWTRAPEAALSHETALDRYAISDVNPNRIHVTVAKTRRLRRTGGEGYEIHYEDLAPIQRDWWQEVPTVTTATAIAQCIDWGTPTHLLRQALENGHAQGRLTTGQRDELTTRLETRHAR